jgi:uncharacterized delta-60 repeat protein
MKNNIVMHFMIHVRLFARQISLSALFILLLCFSVDASIAQGDDSPNPSPRLPSGVKITKTNSTSQRITVGGVDAGFAASLTEGSAQVYSLATQPDGKFLAGGSFTGVNGTTRGSIERFNADGTVDTSFNPGGVGANGAVYVIIPLPDGKILISGNFTGYNDVGVIRIARLNANGTLDQTFNPQGTSASASIQDTIVQPDGKILISGTFTSFNGTTRNRVARLNADGTLDASFNPNVNNFVEELILQPDGKIVIAGIFTNVGGASRNGVARLNADGTLDATFNVGSGVNINGAVYAAERQADGKILIGGLFYEYNGAARENVARLNTDGSLDTTFAPATGGNGVEYFDIQPDGKIIVVGSFFSSNAGIVRLNANGSFDSSFNGGAVDDFGYVAKILPDGKILFGGFFTQYAGATRQSIARLNTNGTADGFAPAITGDPVVRTIIQQADGKILVGGQFRRANGVLRRNVARFNTNGTIDATFDPENNFGGFNSPGVFSLAVQPDGRIMVGGNFLMSLGNARDYVARLNADGSIDDDFYFIGAINIVRDIEIQPDGRILLAGFFFDQNMQLSSGLVRLFSNGGFDSGSLGMVTNGVVLDIEPMPDGKSIIAGSFTTYNGASRNRIVRIINYDGALDQSFNPGAGANNAIYDVLPLPNGQMYVGGFFSSFNNQANTNDLVRLNANGTLDASFNTGASGFNGGIYTLSLESDGKVLAGGNFNFYNSTAVNQLALLDTGGVLDESFTSPLNTNSVNFVYKLYKQSDGKTLVGGGFTVPRNALFRLNSGAVRRTPFDFDGDGKTDISIFRPSVGEWWINRSSNGLGYALQFGSSVDKLTPVDFTGDGKSDVAFFRPNTGEWFVLRSEDNSFYSFPFGANGDIPAPADFDGDNKADAAVFRPSDSTWYIRRSTDGGTTIQTFGQSGDVPVVADYDGDGKADIAVYRVNSGEWWIQRSTSGLIAFQFGNSTDKPVQGDYTGDGKADVALFRQSTGEWFILRSENQSYYSFPFGANGDTPAPGDYDGDGKFDATVFRPSTNTWYSQRTTAGTLIQSFGQNGDTPVPNSFVP